MSEHKGFPQELLKMSSAERKAYFEKFTAKHPHLNDAYDELQWAINEAKPGSLVLVLGPAGVGKTTLLGRAVKYLIEKMIAELERDRELIPVTMIEAVAPDTGNFNWIDYYERLLRALDEPLIGHKIDPEGQKPVAHAKGGSREMAGRALRKAVEEALRHRRLRAVLIDEAQHLATISSGRKLLDQLDSIKSLANMTRTTHVLAGTYGLIQFRNLSAQLSRRSVDVHFRRYLADVPEQLQAFKNILYTFQQHLPLAETPDLVSRWDYFYERTVGCVGVLKDWLLRSLTLAIDEDKKGLTRQIIERRALSVSQCNKMLTEAVEGEREMKEDEQARAELRVKLGLASRAEVAPQPPDVAPPQGPEPGKSPPRQKNRRVGTRKAVRDFIGGAAQCQPGS